MPEPTPKTTMELWLDAIHDDEKRTPDEIRSAQQQSVADAFDAKYTMAETIADHPVIPFSASEAFDICEGDVEKLQRAMKNLYGPSDAEDGDT